MRGWLRNQIDGLSAGQSVRVILDPDGYLDASEIADLRGEGQVETVFDWLALRRAYEESGRQRSPDVEPLLIVVQSEHFKERRQLPYDIDQAAAVVNIRMPVDSSVRAVVLGLPDVMQDQAVAGQYSVNEMLASLWGIALESPGVNAAVELDAAVKLRTDPTVPNEIWPLFRQRVSTPLAIALSGEPPDYQVIQTAWQDWIARGESSQFHDVMTRVGPRLASLFHAGFLTPVPSQRATPRWAAAGVRQRGHREVAESLLATPPVSSEPSSLSDWVLFSEWWGEVRLALSLGSPGTQDLKESAWKSWSAWDTTFRTFVHEGFGRLLTGSAGRPQAVHRIAPFLARRLREGHADRVMLVVFDGMGFQHWSLLRREAGLKVLDASGVLAMAPTLTPISRQAIFAGDLPITFPNHLEDTSHESALWRAFWDNEGVPSASSVQYNNLEGKVPIEVPDFGDRKVVGLVVRAIDELMHSSELLGEAQFTANVATWLNHGFVRALVEKASLEGFEIWLTADHGSLEVIPLGRPMEGLAVDTAGTRVRLYQTRALLEQSKADGDDWMPPGMPASGPYPLFPWGRHGFRHNVRVTHGGISFDEMIVPFVRVGL